MVQFFRIQTLFTTAPMKTLDLSELPLFLIFLIAGIAAVIVWISGTKLSRYTDQLAQRTGTADVILGTLLLGGVTSLPEVVTTVTASSLGNAGIAVNNLLGGVALQVTILAIGDALIPKQSITAMIKSPVVQLQALVCILLLAAASAVIVIGDFAIGRIGVGSVVILLMFTTGFYLVNYLESIHWWRSDPDTRSEIHLIKENIEAKLKEDEENSEQPDESREEKLKSSFVEAMKTKLFLFLCLSALGVLVGGFTIVTTSEELSARLDINSGLVGGIFVALVTSLPEVSTTVSAVRLKKYKLAFSNIFGTNIFTVGFIFLADIFYSDGPILNEVDTLSLFTALLATILTVIYAIGLSMRFRKTYFVFGFDSLLVIIGYLAGVVIMVKGLN